MLEFFWYGFWIALGAVIALIVIRLFVDGLYELLDWLSHKLRRRQP